MSEDFVISNEGVQRFNPCGCVETWVPLDSCSPKAYGYVLTAICEAHTNMRENLEQMLREMGEKVDRLEIDK